MNIHQGNNCYNNKNCKQEAANATEEVWRNNFYHKILKQKYDSKTFIVDYGDP